jgi:hypothetical protein
MIVVPTYLNKSDIHDPKRAGLLYHESMMDKYIAHSPEPNV